MSAVNTIYSALLNIQKELPKIEKDKINPHFKNKYASLPHILSILLPILNKEGVVLYSGMAASDPDIYNVYLHHVESATQIGSSIKLIHAADMQKWGGAITYATRYGVLSLLGISADMDDDGQTAVEGIQQQYLQGGSAILHTWKQVKEKAMAINKEKAEIIDKLIASNKFVSHEKYSAMAEWINSL